MRALGDVSDVERKLGAAIKALTALEAELGEFKAKAVGCNFATDVKSELRQAYGCISRARLGVMRLQQGMKPDPARWLEIAENRNHGRQAMRLLKQNCQDALSYLTGVHILGVKFMSAKWEHRPLWDRIYDGRVNSMNEIMRTADRSFIVASFQPRRGRS